MATMQQSTSHPAPHGASGLMAGRSDRFSQYPLPSAPDLRVKITEEYGCRCRKGTSRSTFARTGRRRP